MRPTTHLYVTLIGGPNYGHDPIAEHFPSLRAACAKWQERRHSYRFPCWGSGTAPGDTVAAAWFLSDDHPAVTVHDNGTRTADTADVYPDRMLVVGPRLGLNWQPC